MNGEDEVFGTIWVNFGSVTDNGLAPGSAEKRLIMSGAQLSRLAERFESWEVIHAIGLVVRHNLTVKEPVKNSYPPIEGEDFGEAYPR